MAGCENYFALFDLNGQNGLAEIDSDKSLSLREAADATKRTPVHLCQPPEINSNESFLLRGIAGNTIQAIMPTGL